MKILCEEHFNEVLAYAESINDKTLNDCLERLKKWEEGKDYEVYLMSDRSPYSFYFEMRYPDGKRYMNGGLLYHGKPDQSRAYTLDPTKGWQIHT